MNGLIKAGLGVGVTSFLALGIALPVFSNVNVKTLNVSGVQATTSYVADEGEVEKVTEESTDSTTEASTEEAEVVTEADPYGLLKHPNYIEFSYENIKGIEIPILDEKYANMDNLLDYNEAFDINKYDDELQKIAQDYLAQGLYLSDLEFEAKVFTTGVGYSYLDADKNMITEVWFTNGFDVVDDNNGNNTFWISVLRMTPEEFALYEKKTEIIDKVPQEFKIECLLNLLKLFPYLFLDDM